MPICLMLLSKNNTYVNIFGVISCLRVSVMFKCKYYV